MAPIFDTDIAEERWTADVWKTYELWEKVERRVKRKRRFWLSGAAFAFVLLSAIPVLRDAMPKWQSLKASRLLATAISEARLRAAHDRRPVRVSLESRNGEVLYRVEQAESCASTSGKVLSESSLFASAYRGSFMSLPTEVAIKHGIPGVVRAYCYDPFKQDVAGQNSSGLLAFALLPVNDLAETRFDRMSMVIIDPISGAVSID